MNETVGSRFSNGQHAVQVRDHDKGLGISEPSQKSFGHPSKSTPERENSVLNADSAVFKNRPALTAFGHRLYSTRSCAAKVGRDRLLLLEDATAEERDAAD